MIPNQAPRPARAVALLTILALGGCGDGDDPAAEHDAGASSAASAGLESRPRTPLDVEVKRIPAEGSVAEDAPATLRGVARLEGPVPARRKVAMDHIPGCRGHDAPLTEAVIATEDGRLQNVFVYVSGGIDRASAPPAPDEPVVLQQSGCVFRPHITTVRAGQTIAIQNLDKTNHNVRAKPQHGSNRAFNKIQPALGEDLMVVFPRAEIGIAISCDLHTWMNAYVCVVDHPHHALSDEEGNWSIEVPPGKYVVEAWHERFGARKVAVTVGPGETAELGFVYEVKKGKKNKQKKP